MGGCGTRDPVPVKGGGKVDHADGFPASGAGQSADRLGPDGDPRHRLQPAELALHLQSCLGSEHRRPPDPLPLGPGPLLALDAALPDVAPLPLGDGQGEVQQELSVARLVAPQAFSAALRILPKANISRASAWRALASACELPGIPLITAGSGCWRPTGALPATVAPDGGTTGYCNT